MLQPYVARLNDLVSYGERAGRRFRIVAGRKLEEEYEWRGGDWRIIDGLKPILLSSDFELGVALPGHGQDMHMHRYSYEVYIFLGDSQVEYIDADNGCVRMNKLGRGDLIIFPPGLFHKVTLMNGLMYAVLIAAGQGKSLGKDKVMLSEEQYRGLRHCA